MKIGLIFLILFLFFINFVDASIVINEIMPNPSIVSDTNGEWFELYNSGYQDVDINGWVIKDNGTNSHVIDNNGSLIVPAKGYIVLGRNSNLTENGGVYVDYEYSGFTLANTEDEVILMNGDSVVDEVYYDDTFPFSSGHSMELINPELNNNLSENWGESVTQFGDGDYGTPGERNSVYVASDYDCVYLSGDGNIRTTLMGSVLINAAGVIQVKNYDSIELNGNWTMDYVGEWLFLTGNGSVFVENWFSNMSVRAGGSGSVEIDGYYNLRLDGFGFKVVGCD